MVKREKINTAILTGRKINPLHVGSVLKEILEDYGISQNALAKHINVDYVKVNEICNEKRGLSTEMAIRLGKAFEPLHFTYSFWMGIQRDYEEKIALIKNPEFERIEPIAVNE